MVLALLLCLSFGCASKTREAQDRGDAPKTGKKKSKSKATQRPYVIKGITYYPLPSSVGYAEQGIASWYGPGFHGRRSASGEQFNQNTMTAAHRTLPFGTQVRVTNLRTGASVVVRINDRGPFTRGRVIDLSRAAAGAIGMIGSGVAPVKVEVLQ